MKIQAKIVKRFSDTEKVRAIANVVFEDSLALHGVKIINGIDDVFIAMPNRKIGDEYKDVFHPINSNARAEISKVILSAYNEV
ncbi:MAG: SpoVG family protein [Oscillospiraceae bacterium]